MRKKLDDSRKRKKISTTINTELWNLLEKYAEETGQKKSRILEKWIKNGLNDPNIVQKLNDEGIILPNSKLLE